MPSVVLFVSPRSTLVTIFWHFESFKKIWRLQPYVFVRMKARMWGTKEPSSTSTEEIPCTKLKRTNSDNIFWEYFFTEKPFSSDGGNETVQRVFVDQTPSLLICRLVHYPRLHNIGRSPHDGSDQTEGNQCEGWGRLIVILTPHMLRTWCVSECCPPGWCCPVCSSWHCRRWRDHRGSPGQLDTHLANSRATVPLLRLAGELSWQLSLIYQSVSQSVSSYSHQQGLFDSGLVSLLELIL